MCRLLVAMKASHSARLRRGAAASLSTGKTRSRSCQQTCCQQGRTAVHIGRCCCFGACSGSTSAPRQQFQHVERIPPGCNIPRPLDGPDCELGVLACAVGKVDGPLNLAVTRGLAEIGWDSPVRRTIMVGYRHGGTHYHSKPAKVARNLPESGITYQILVSPEHHPSAAVFQHQSVKSDRSSSSHCNEFRQSVSQCSDRRGAWCGTTLEKAQPI